MRSSDVLGLGCLRGGTEVPPSFLAAASVLGASHGGGGAL